MDVQGKELDEQEIDLYQYWLIIEKRWKLILGFVLIAVIAASVFLKFQPKIYCVTTMINQGRIATINTGGDRGVPIASPADIQQLIGSGSFAKPILRSLKMDESLYESSLLKNVTTEIKDNSEYILIKYETAKPEEGKKILGKLIQELQTVLNKRITSYQNFQETEMAKVREASKLLEYEIEKCKIEIKTLTDQIESKNRLARINSAIFVNEKNGLKDQIDRLNSRIKTIRVLKEKLVSISSTLEQNTQDLIKGKSSLLQNAGKDGVIASILFSNNLQQNINSLNYGYERIKKYEIEANDCEDQILQLKNQMISLDEKIKEVLTKTELETQELKGKIQENQLKIAKIIPAEIGKMKSEIDALEVRKNMIEGISTIADPDYVNIPVKPQKRPIVLAAGAVAFFAGILVAFFLEWRRANRNNPVALNSSSEPHCRAG